MVAALMGDRLQIFHALDEVHDLEGFQALFQNGDGGPDLIARAVTSEVAAKGRHRLAGRLLQTGDGRFDDSPTCSTIGPLKATLVQPEAKCSLGDARLVGSRLNGYFS
jgi:hypothetical protein